jgi:hypothetical protein
MLATIRPAWLALVLPLAFSLYKNDHTFRSEERVHVSLVRTQLHGSTVSVAAGSGRSGIRSKAGGEESVRNLPWAREFDARVQQARLLSVCSKPSFGPDPNDSEALAKVAKQHCKARFQVACHTSMHYRACKIAAALSAPCHRLDGDSPY